MDARGVQALGSDLRTSAAPLFELRAISKKFPGVKALDNVSFEIRAGETHMLLGENGAGKSMLMKVLFGAYQSDAGSFFHSGQKVEIKSPMDARRFGIAVIFQDFTLVPFLDIAQNIFIGREFSGRVPGTIDWRRLYQEASRVLDMIGFNIDPTLPVHSLGVAQQQMVEIAKALSQDARILVMDEPTAALSDRESELLFAMIARLKAQGVAIIYISHRLPEVFALGDRITILRDGRRIASLLPSETTPDELVTLMVGRPVDHTYVRDFLTPGDVVLEVKDLASDNGVSGINLNVRAGEIVGLCGLVGSGRSEVARAIFGADRATSGDIRLFGDKVKGLPEESVRLGMAMIPEDRKTQGLALGRSVRDNIVLAGLSKMFPSGLFSPGRARRAAQAMIDKLRIATPSPNRPVDVLSGGNQQKVVIGKWLNADSKFFIFDEPTRGIDVGAKAEIFALLDRLVHEGAAILMISSEQNEIVHVCDRAYVMRDGRIAGELARNELTEANIVRLSIRETVYVSKTAHQAAEREASLISRIPGVAAALAVLLLMFSFTSPNFLNVGNITNILMQSTILLLVALPMTLIIMTEGLDLSAGAVLTFASIVLATVTLATGSVAFGLLAGLGTGLAFGVLNGSLIAFLGIPPFIVTLGTLGVAQGLSLVVTDGQSIVGIPRTIEQLYSTGAFGIPFPIIISVLAYALMHILLYHTRFGTYIFALGGNREALRLAGVSDRKILIAVYGLGGLMAGFAALLMTARMNAAHPTAAIGFEFEAITAVAVGGTSFERGDGWLLGTLLGVLAVGVLRNGLNLLAVPSSVQVACIGALVIIALLIDGLRSRT